LERRPLPPFVRTALLVGLPWILLGALSACYTYAPMAEGPAPPGEDVRVYLTAAGRERVGELLPADQRWLEGTVVRHGADGLLLRVRTSANPENPTTRSLAQTLPLADGDIAAIEARAIDGLKTGLIVGIAAAAGAGILAKILSGSGEDTSGPGGGGGTDALIPAVPPAGASSPPR